MLTKVPISGVSQKVTLIGVEISACSTQQRTSLGGSA
jgi:hypothetical protein